MKFLLTRELGRLAKWLRMLGFDARYFQEENKGRLMIEALRDNRIILTRNSRLPQTKGVQILRIQNDDLKGQIKQLLEDLKIKPDAEAIFSRCTLCNVELIQIQKEKTKDRVPEYVFKTQTDFLECPSCKRIYWQGTHWGNVKSLIAQIE